MDKVIKDGKVAVLISSGYGAGWSTWRISNEKLLFCPEIVNIVLQEPDNMTNLVMEKAEDLFGYHYYGGADGLKVVWVEEGARFRVHEYDGDETLILLEDDDYYTA